jgi:hypothetical protein
VCPNDNTPSPASDVSLTHPSPAAAPADSFFDRASQLVAFLAESPAAPPARHEHELADWIARWQRALGPQGWKRAQHFVGDELGIIMRALTGPRDAQRSSEPNQQLCWLLARCMAQAA